jgi:hypothetical protein
VVIYQANDQGATFTYEIGSGPVTYSLPTYIDAVTQGFSCGPATYLFYYTFDGATPLNSDLVSVGGS